MTAECTLLRWATRPRPLTRTVVAARDGVLVEAVPAGTNGTGPRRTPYASGALCDLRRAGYAVVVLATAGGGTASGTTATGDTTRALAMEATTAALDVLDPGRQLVDYAIVCAHRAGDGSAGHDVSGLGALEREAGTTVDGGWVVGDRIVDLDRGRALGLRTALVATGDGVATWSGLGAAERSAVDLRSSMFAEAVRHLLLADRAAGHAADATGA